METNAYSAEFGRNSGGQINVITKSGGNRPSGSAYLFERGVGNSWVSVEKILSPDGEPGDVFGQAVALHGGVALIGAPNAAPSGVAHGVVYARLIPN